MFDLKLFRQVNKLSQINAAKYFGCDQSFISQIETNLRPIPDAFISKVLADSHKLMTEDIYKIEIDNSTCQLCIQKDKTIKALEMTISLMQEKISSLENKTASNSSYQQTG